MSFIGREQGFPYNFRSFGGPTPFLEPLYGNVIDLESIRYHRSKIDLALVRDDVRMYKNSAPSLLSNPVFRCAFDKVSRMFQLPRQVRPMHLRDVFKEPLNIWNSSPGLPYNMMGIKTKRQVIENPQFANDIRWIWHRVKCGEDVKFPDSCGFVRSHLAPPTESKVRAVWGYPISMVLGEAQFAVPLIKAYSRRPDVSPIAYGYETALAGVARVTRRFAKRKNIFGLDFKGFDKTVPSWLIEAAFAILAQNIDFCKYQDYGITNVRAILNQWTKIQEYFIETIIRLPNGERWQKRSGVASGSYFTQLIDSICNALIIQFICLMENCDLYDLLVLGDDSLFSSPGLKLDRVCKLVEYYFDMRINFMKSGVSDRIEDLEFLGFELRNAVPNKSYEKWMASLIYPEHFDKSASECASRTLGLYMVAMGTCRPFHALCHRILTCSSGLDIAFSRDMEKFLRLNGIDPGKLSYDKLPDEIEFQRRLMLSTP